MRPRLQSTNLLLAATLTLGAAQAQALTELSDDSLSEVQGAGLAFAFDDFRFQMAPTSYFEQLGTAVDLSDTDLTFSSGNYRWIGTTISSGADVPGELYHFSDYASATHGSIPAATCATSISSLDCPIALGGASGYADLNNPFLLRVREYAAVGRDTGFDATDPDAGWVRGVDNTVAELVGATRSAPFRWAFWGQVEVTDNDGVPVAGGLMENQEIIIGAPVSRLRPDGGTTYAGNPDDPGNITGPVFRLFLNQTDRSLGMIYHHRLSGDYRFSAYQTEPGSANNGVPTFGPEEGMYFTQVNTFLPLGQMHYQSLILDGNAVKDGNFVIEVTRVPDIGFAYHDFYGYTDPTTGTPPTMSSIDYGYKRTVRDDRYYETHGYVRWGDAFPTNTNPNGLGGSGGVSEVRFSGPGSISTSQTVNVYLDSVVVNSSNFPNGDDAGYCNGSDFDRCDRWSGAIAPEINRNYTRTGLTPAQSYNVGNTKQNVLAAGGMAFVASPGNTWTLPDNQNQIGGSLVGYGKQLFSLHPDTLQARLRTDSYGCGFLGLGTCYELDARNPYNAGQIDNVANSIIDQIGVTTTVEVNAINLGSSRVEGMTIQHLKVTTLGAD